MAKITDPDRIMGYCPKCGTNVYLIFVSVSECIDCDWKGGVDKLVGEKSGVVMRKIRREKLDKINEQQNI